MRRIRVSVDMRDGDVKARGSGTVFFAPRHCQRMKQKNTERVGRDILVFSQNSSDGSSASERGIVSKPPESGCAWITAHARNLSISRSQHPHKRLRSSRQTGSWTSSGNGTALLAARSAVQLLSLLFICVTLTLPSPFTFINSVMPTKHSSIS